MAKDKRAFVNCLTAPPIGSQTSDSTWDGKCMYINEAKLKELVDKFKATNKNPTQEEGLGIWVDTGLTCKVTSTDDLPVTTTNVGTFPVGLQTATLKENVKTDDANSFQAQQTDLLMDAYMRNALADYDTRAQSLFNFADFVAKPAAPVAPVPAPAPSRPQIVPLATGPSPVVAPKEVMVESSWSPLKIAMVSMASIFGIVVFILMIVWLTQSPNVITSPPAI